MSGIMTENPGRNLAGRGFLIAMLGLGLALALSACAAKVPIAPAPAAGANVPAQADYRLGAGDKVRVIVFGEEDLSGEFDIDGTGVASLPLIGQIKAENMTLRQFEESIAVKLREGYLTDPKVNAEVMNYRPFYIIGEVTNPGEYPYTNGMNVLNAVAVAGGYSYRADTSRAYITRDEAGEQQYPASPQVKVLPGDVVRIPERFF